MNLFFYGTVPCYNFLFDGTVTSYKFLFHGTVPVMLMTGGTTNIKITYTFREIELNFKSFKNTATDYSDFFLQIYGRYGHLGALLGRVNVIFSAKKLLNDFFLCERTS